MAIRITQGDLLRQDDVDAIVNTVNCVGVMGKGIALQFRNRWPENFRAYEAACKASENGGLEWNEVRPLIESAFAGLPDVEVRLFEPAGAPDSKSMEVKTRARA